MELIIVSNPRKKTESYNYRVVPEIQISKKIELLMFIAHVRCDLFFRSGVPLTPARWDFYQSDGFQIVIFSGRSKGTIHTTKQWLNKHNVPWSRLFMRPIKDFTPDDILKKDWLDDIGKNNVLCTFDDRQKVVDMWRANGISCFQVAPGNF